jgi:hypothetical protein
LNYEKIKIDPQSISTKNTTGNGTEKDEVIGLYIQYGIQIDSDETSHLYLSYFDTNPLDPAYYSFGSRNYDVQVLNAHLEPFDVEEQIRLRCKKSSTNINNKAVLTACDYKCNRACDGCTAPFAVTACKKCAFAGINAQHLRSGPNVSNTSSIVCVEKCPPGYEPNKAKNNLCIGSEYYSILDFLKKF